MTPRDRYDALTKQTEIAFNSFNTRRDYEWKITLAFWGLIALSTQFLYGKLAVSFWTLSIAALAVSALHGIWLHGVWRAHECDKSIMDTFRRYAVDALAGREIGVIKIPEPKTGVHLEFLFNWAMSFQLLTTLSLAATSIYILTRPIHSCTQAT